MFDFNEKKTVSAVKSSVREIAFSNLRDAFEELYGKENVSVIDSNEIAVCLGTRTLEDGTVGEVCFTVKPVAKDFDVRTTESGKTFMPFERLSEADAFEVAQKEKAEKAEKDKAEKEARKERDKAAREAAKKKK